jgi:SAM-dependent methyltransferase
MRPDIVNLRQFYSSRLGRKVKWQLQQAVPRWSATDKSMMVGMGYMIPLLTSRPNHPLAQARLAALMPASQGGVYWPVRQDNRTILADEMRPPFATNSLPYIVMMHSLEHSANAEEQLKIVWQLLMPGGQLFLVVPNRQGFWSCHGETPFHSGESYRLSELKTLLNAADFTVVDTASALYGLPSEHPLNLRLFGLVEWLGRVFLPRRGGVLLVTAEKQIYAAVGERVRVRAQKSNNWAPAVGAAPV